MSILNIYTINTLDTNSFKPDSDLEPVTLVIPKAKVSLGKPIKLYCKTGIVNDTPAYMLWYCEATVNNPSLPANHTNITIKPRMFGVVVYEALETIPTTMATYSHLLNSKPQE